MRGQILKRLLMCTMFVVAIAGVACGGDDEGGATAEPAADQGGGNVTLTATNFAFDPSALSAPAGATIEFTNEDDAEHSFTITDADVDEDVAAKGSTTVDVGSLEAGSYDFFCRYHKDTMTGTLEITE